MPLQDKRYHEMKEHFNAMEFVISEMESKCHEMFLRNFDFDFTESKKKIQLLKDAQGYIYDSFDKLKEGSKREFKLECTILTLSKKLEI